MHCVVARNPPADLLHLRRSTCVGSVPGSATQPVGNFPQQRCSEDLLIKRDRSPSTCTASIGEICVVIFLSS
jgi:hypothetical protein